MPGHRTYESFVGQWVQGTSASFMCMLQELRFCMYKYSKRN